MFESATGHGFRMTFNNGYSVSVQWGPSNYCSNRNKRLSLTGTAMDSATAECAVFSPSGQFVRMDGWHDDVNGHMNADDVLALMHRVANYIPGRYVLDRLEGGESDAR